VVGAAVLEVGAVGGAADDDAEVDALADDDGGVDAALAPAGVRRDVGLEPDPGAVHVADDDAAAAAGGPGEGLVHLLAPCGAVDRVVRAARRQMRATNAADDVEEHDQLVAARLVPPLVAPDDPRAGHDLRARAPQADHDKAAHDLWVDDSLLHARLSTLAPRERTYLDEQLGTILV